MDSGTRVFVDKLKDMEPAKTTPEASLASAMHPFVSFSSHQRGKASPGLTLVWSLAWLLSRFLFLTSSDNVFLGFFAASTMMSIQRILL